MIALEELRTQINELLIKVDFEAIWARFSPCPFAIFDTKNVYLDGSVIPWDDRFLGNTVIEYNDDMLAIWGILDVNEIDVDRVASGLVHEMFHALQKQQGEKRYVNELAFLQYAPDVDAGNLALAESHYLIRAFADATMDDLEQFVALRQARSRILGYMFHQEMLVETVEGMAEFAGLLALNQINRAKFVEDVSMHMGILRSAKSLCNPRLRTYSSGALICLSLKTLGIDFHHHLSNDKPLFDFVPKTENAIHTAIEAHQSSLKQMFGDFTKSHHNKTEINAYITGFDPMNMYRLNDQILCKRFVTLDGQYIEGPVMLQMTQNSPNHVISYVKNFHVQ